MKIHNTIRKKRLVKTIFLLTAILVAALFFGSAVSAGIARTTTTPIEKTQPSGDYSEDSRTAPIMHNEGELKKTQPTTSIKTTILSEGFEGTFPPTGWSQIITNAGYTWKSASYNPHGGTLYTNCEYDPALVPQDEWLVTPVLDFTGYGSIYLSFWWYMSYYWGVSPYDNYDINVKISTDGGSTWTQLWNEDTIGTFTNWEWYDATFGTHVDLSSYIGQTNVKLGFQYIGTDGAEAALDDILVYGSIAGDHNLGILSIDTPESGNAGTITPTVTIQNLGTSDEFNVPLHLLIGKRQVTGTIEDFETTNGGYTATGTPTIVWEWGTPTLSTGPSTAHSCVNVWGTDLDANYPASCNNKLDTASFVVPPYAELTFWHWYDTEASYDGANVKISADDGTTWTVLTPAGGYTGNANSANPLYPEPIWTGHVQKFWEKESVDLSAYNGQTVMIRFHFGSDGSVNYPGWYIDDVGITTSAWVNEYNQTQNFDIASGETIQVTMPAWTPADINVQEDMDIDYLAEADVTVTGDIDPADNYLAKPFSLHFGYFHDVAVTEIVSPTDGPAEETTPEVVLANNGQNDETVSVNMYIEKIEYSNQWTQEQYSGQGIWERWDPEDLVYCQPAYGSGSFMAASSDDHDGWTFDVEIFTHSMDMTGETSVDFSCAENFQDIGADDTAQIGIYSDGVLQETAYYQYGVDDPSGGGVVLYNFDPSTYADPSDVQIGFYYSNGVGTWDWGFGIDDILVESATVTYIDWNFEASTFPPAEMSFIFEYNETVTVDVPFGESMNVVFPDWTPSDMTLSFDLDYRVSATATLGGFITIGTEGFEFYTAGHYGFPSGWTVSQTNPSTWFVYGTGTTHTSKCQETGSLNLAQNELLTSPSFNFAGMNTVKLQYSAYFYRATTNGDSYVEVVGSIDGGVSWPQLIKTYTATGGVSYSEDIDISAWAANQPSVTIGYRFVSDADINLTDYFYFDNFWIGNEVPIVTESFSSYTPGYYAIPAGWTVTPTNPSTWFVYGTGTTHQMKCQETGSLNLSQNEFLTSPVFNLGGMTVVKLQYSAYFYRAITNGDSYVEVVGSLDGGVSWPQLIKTYTATGGVSYSEDIDISAWAANQPTVQIGYRFVSPADSNLTDYFYFDGFWIGNEVPVVAEYFNSYVAGYYAIPTGWTRIITNPTGKWWMYQSGTTVYPKVNESGSNGQAQDEWIISKTIDCSALTNVSVQFTKYFYRSTTGPDSTAQVLGSIDGGATWPYYIVNYTASNTSTTMFIKYITAWAAGQANVQIAFRFTSTADASLYDYFYFDDFFVGSMWGPYGNNPPTGWTILDKGSESPPVWNYNDWHRYSSSTYPAQGQFTRVNYGSPTENQNDWLISPSIDCSALTTVTLEFWHYFNWLSISKGYINGSIDGGVTFPYVIASYTTADDGPAVRTFDISSWAAGQSSVKILFQYMDNNGWYWYVDDFKIKSGTTTIYSQNFEGVGYLENFASNYIPATWGPLGWYVTPTSDTHWSVTNTANAGGTIPEARFYYSPSATGNFSLCSGPMDTSAYTALTLSFKHYVDWSTNPFTLKVETSTDGTTWGTVWSISPTADIPASTVAIPLTGTEGIGSPTFRMRFTFSGYTYNINYWYIDNVKLGTMVTIYTTTFNENWIPSSWGPGGFTDVIQQGTHGWLRNDLYNNRPNYAGGQGYCADADSDAVGSGGPWPMECALISPSMDLTSLTSVMLSYTAAYNDISTGATTDYANVDISIDGGISWTTLSHWDEDHSAYGPGEAIQLDISSYCGNANVQIRFHYFAPGWDYYFEVDNVKLATVSTVYNTTFNENWIPTSWGPAGWQQVVVSGTDPDNEWDVVTTGSHPSGVVPHGETHMAQYDSYYISGDNSCRLYMPNPIDFSSIGSPAIQATMWMYHDPGYSSDDDRVEVQVSLDGTTWNTVGSVSRYAPVAHWEEHTFDFSAYATETTVYIGFLGISEYGNSIYIDDLSLEYYGLLPDGNPSDNEMVNWITLTYTHDTGVTEITQPTGPEGNWPPGTYSVAGVIENFGSFTEYDVLVNTKIWKIVEEKADILFYEENVTVPALAIDGTAAVTFPDVTFENADEGNFRLEMRTMLAGDDHPNNDKMTKTFVIQAPDTTPPVTTAELTGTIGQDNWYVTNVTITLTATDPAGKIFKGEGDGKWPLGVNHTYYKIDSDNWTEYIEPIVVTEDGQHKICFYSDDKAIPPNVEEEKNVSFKMDKTAPEWINYTITPLNLLKTKWLCAANVTDATSGIVLVEFYVDDALVGNATTIPYEFTYEGSGNNSQAVAYDAAGNSAMSPIVSSTEFIVTQQQYTQSQQTMQSLKLKLA